MLRIATESQHSGGPLVPVPIRPTPSSQDIAELQTTGVFQLHSEVICLILLDGSQTPEETSTKIVNFTIV